MAKIKEYKPDYIKETVIETDIPGLGKEMLDANVSVRGSSNAGGQANTTGQYVGRTDPGDVTYSGFGFTPKKVMIQGAGGTVGIGYFTADGTKKDSSTNLTGTTGHLVWSESPTSGDINNGFLKEFTSDGVTITWDRIDDQYLYFYITCFSTV